MTMTAKRLAELDAVMAKATAVMRAHEAFLLTHDLDMHGACPDESLDEIAGEVDAAQRDLRAHISAQAATIEKLLMAIRSAVDDFQLVVERIDDNQIDRAKGTAMAGERAATRTVLTATGAA